MNKQNRPSFTLALDVHAVNFHPCAPGEPYMSADVTMVLRGTTISRTLVAYDDALEAIRAAITPGAKGVRLKCHFERAKANDEGVSPPEYLVALGLGDAQAA